MMQVVLDAQIKGDVRLPRRLLEALRWCRGFWISLASLDFAKMRLFPKIRRSLLSSHQTFASIYSVI